MAPCFGLGTFNPRFVAWPLELGLGTFNPCFVAWPLELGLGTLNPPFFAWPLELGLGMLHPRFVAWPLELGLGNFNRCFVVRPLELGLGTFNPRCVVWPLDLGLGTHNPRLAFRRLFRPPPPHSKARRPLPNRSSSKLLIRGDWRKVLDGYLADASTLLPRDQFFINDLSKQLVAELRAACQLNVNLVQSPSLATQKRI